MTTAVMTYYRTSVGKKMVMALTGLALFGFVTVHMLGNLQVFLGPKALNHYAEVLQGQPALVWMVRLIMLTAVVLHIVAATQVTLQSWGARPVKYSVQRYRESTYASRTMRWGGPILALFIVYHLLHLTVGSAHPNAANFDHGSVYNNVVLGFQVPWVSGFYIVAMIALGLHLYHGAWSLLQTMGANHPKYNRWRQVFAFVFAIVISVGNISMPVAVLAGMVKPVF